MKDINTFFTSHTFRGILIGVGSALIVLVIFQTGVFVGYRKASFSYRFGDNYSRMFGDPDARGFGMGMMGGPAGEFFVDGNGAVGNIVSINLPSFVVVGPDNIEKVVVIGEDTRMRRFNETIASSDLKVGDSVVVFGVPNESAQIDAKLIRLLPERPQGEARN